MEGWPSHGFSPGLCFYQSNTTLKIDSYLIQNNSRYAIPTKLCSNSFAKSTRGNEKLDQDFLEHKSKCRHSFRYHLLYAMKNSLFWLLLTRISIEREVREMMEDDIFCALSFLHQQQTSELNEVLHRSVRSCVGLWSLLPRDTSFKLSP